MARRAAAQQHVGRWNVRGIRPRLQPHCRGGAPDPRHLNQPSRRCRSVDGDQRRGRPDQRPAADRVMITGAPLPAITEDSAGFWEGTAAEELRIQRCSNCKRLRFPPRPMCPYCNSLDHTWDAMSGRGRVWSFVIPHPPLLPAFMDLAPYNVVVVELDEDPLIRLV